MSVIVAMVTQLCHKKDINMFTNISFKPHNDLIDFTLSNVRRFYSSKADSLVVKGITGQFIDTLTVASSDKERLIMTHQNLTAENCFEPLFVLQVIFAPPYTMSDICKFSQNCTNLGKNFHVAAFWQVSLEICWVSIKFENTPCKQTVSLQSSA